MKKYEIIEVMQDEKKYTVLVFTGRITREEWDEAKSLGLTYCAIRESDDAFYGTLEKKVWVNHMCDALTKDIDFDIIPYIKIEDNYKQLNPLTIEEFANL